MKQPIRIETAFSLVEVTLALGIAAFCLIAVVGIIPVGMQTNRDSTSQSAAINIMAAVVSDMRAAQPTKTTSAQFGIIFGTAKTLYFDGTGQFTTVLNTNSRYRMNVTWSSSGWNALKYADVKVWWPASATAANARGSTEMFAAFDRN